MSERWILTPAGGGPLVLPLAARDGGCQVTAIDTPSPPARDTWAPRPEGALRTVHEYENREITLQLQLFPPADPWATTTHDFGRPPAEAEGDGPVPGWTGTVRRVASDGNPLPPMISDLVATVAADPGTVRRVLDDGTFIDFDVLASEITDAPKWDLSYYAARATTLTIKLTCAPFGRGKERLLGEGTKQAASRLVRVDELAVPGDVPALARISFSGVTVPQRSLLFAADLPDQATRTVGVELSASALGVPAGSSTTSQRGAVSSLVVRRPATSIASQGGSASPAALTAGMWEPLLLLQQGGSPLDVRGIYDVRVRVRAPSGGTIRMRSSASARSTGMRDNGSVVLDAVPGWQLVRVGVVYIPPRGSLSGAIERLMPAYGELDVDEVLLLPATRSATAAASTAAPVVVPSHIDPMTGSGALVGSAPQIGGSWQARSGSGPAWTRTGAGATRVTSLGAALAVGMTVPSASCRMRFSSTFVPGSSSGQPVPPTLGMVVGDADGIASVIGGSTGTAGWAVGAAWWVGPTNAFATLYAIGGGIRNLGEGQTAAIPSSAKLDMIIDYTVPGRLAVTATAGGVRTTPALAVPVAAPSAGQLYVALVTGSQTVGTATVSDVTVQRVADGEIADQVLWPGTFADLTSDSAVRSTPDGGSGPVAIYEGDRPYLPATGTSGRSARVTVAASRSDLRGGEDLPSDALTARVFATPRYLHIPDENA